MILALETDRYLTFVLRCTNIYFQFIYPCTTYIATQRTNKLQPFFFNENITNCNQLGKTIISWNILFYFFIFPTAEEIYV